MSGGDPTKKLQALVKRLRTDHGELGETPPEVPALPEDPGPLLRLFLHSMLLWEASTSQAASAMKRIAERVVDVNELRVCFAPEVAEMLGDRYPRAQERAERLRASMNEIYRREHALSLERVSQLPKKDARKYLESIEGVPGFVSARVTLLGLGQHAMPCDERLHDLLVAEGAIEKDVSPDGAGAWLERQTKAGEGVATHALLQRYSDEHGTSAARKPKPAPEPASKPLPKKAKPVAAKPAGEAAKPRKSPAKPASAKKASKGS